MTNRKQYGVILADPPWLYNDKCCAGERGAVYKYPVLSVRDLRKFHVKHVAADDCALFLWTTMPMIPDALEVMSAWGFSFKTVAFTWVKRTANGKLHWGMGNWTRANPELVLFGVRGKPKRVSKAVHSVVEAKVREHSRKPDEVRNRIVELMGDVPRLEMFARPPVCAGWDVWGNDVDDDVEIPMVDVQALIRRLAAVKRRVENSE